MFTAKKIERVSKGFANHRRVQIMLMLDAEPGLSVEEVVEKLQINYKTASEHIRRLTIAGIVKKRNRARNVIHALTPRGYNVLTFLRKLE